MKSIDKKGLTCLYRLRKASIKANGIADLSVKIEQATEIEKTETKRLK